MLGKVFVWLLAMSCCKFHCFPNYFPGNDGTRCHDSSFWMLSFKPTFSLSSFTFIKRLFSSSLLSDIRVVSSAYLRLLKFLPAVLIPACASFSPEFLMMYSAFTSTWLSASMHIFVSKCPFLWRHQSDCIRGTLMTLW